MIFHQSNRTSGRNRFRDIPFNKGLLVLVSASVVFIAFFRLGNGEIQSWDEAMYLVRAKACLNFGAWLDQTRYSCGGLYSSSHPPLGIWVYAVTRIVAGASTFASRLPSACGYLLSIFFLYKFLRLHISQSSSVLGAASLAAAQTYVLYAHRAQLDAMLVAWMLLSLYCFAISLRASGSLSLYLSGIAFGCALLTKFGFAVCLLPFIALYTPKEQRGKAMVMASIGIALAAPWYAYLYMAHPGFGQHAAQLVSTMQYDSLSQHPWYYYLNQCVVNAPLIVPAMCVLAFRTTWDDRLLRGSLGWFGVTLALLQAMQTKMPHFSILLFPPLCIIVAIAGSDLKLSRKRGIVVLMSAILAVMWSSSEQLRLLTTHRMQGQYIHPPFLILAIFLMLAILFTVLFSLFFLREDHRILVPGVAVLMLLVESARLVVQSPVKDVSGAQAVLDSIRTSDIHHITVYTSYEPHAELLPQLAYYSDGETLGWDSIRQWSVTNYRDTVATPVQSTSAAIVEIGHDRLAPSSNDERLYLTKLEFHLQQLYPHRRLTHNYQLYY